ncbi:MAG: methyltransferase domain-containing protein [Actinomycetota bacterium]|nr:methyltransferase domain-containing protein [Actinomycetota bacterium]
MPFDPAAFRDDSLDGWERAARGWGERRAVIQDAGQPVSAWLIDAIEPQPGHRVLELAAGTGDTGFMAAELIEPGGALISSDAAPAMVEQARARAAELGVTNVEFRTIDAERIDLPTAHVDGVLARWVYMLVADPDSALRETRRVLRPGGRVALAAWADQDDNPWASVARQELLRMGATEPPDPDEPDMFAFHDPERIEELLGDAGFTEIQVESLDIVFRYDDLDHRWDAQLDLSPGLSDTVSGLTRAQRDDLRHAIDAQLAVYVSDDGTVAVPGRTHVAAATA